MHPFSPQPPPPPVTQHTSSEPGEVAGMGFGLVRRAGPSPAGARARGQAETAVAERERGPRPGWGEGKEVRVGGGIYSLRTGAEIQSLLSAGM